MGLRLVVPNFLTHEISIFVHYAEGVQEERVLTSHVHKLQLMVLVCASR